MIPLHSLLPELAQREVRWLHVGVGPGADPGPGLPAGEYAFVEHYCEDLNCDCRRVFLKVIERNQTDRVLASINYGWENEAFYREHMPWDPEAPRQVVEGSLDPINPQSRHSEELLRWFQMQVLDESYRQRLRRHWELFRDELRRQTSAASPGSGGSADDDDVRDRPTPPSPAAQKIPPERHERFNEVVALMDAFARQHLDAELTGFVMELWSRICRRKAPDCLRGKPAVWAASVVHVIARMNFLFDRGQPVHLKFDTICKFFQTNKTTIGGKASEIERNLRLRQHSEPGLCRREFLESFTMVRLSSGMVVPWRMARELGCLPPDAKLEDLS
ncbi:MAG: hypothetical protein KF791_10990 [Verrucomicrobiae bacterium]|nr:hypothetical protein [Verrucomicrobiae bacterium]